MPSITSYITSGADDGYLNTDTETVVAGDNECLLGYDGDIDYLAFFRFSSVNIPKNAKITSAYLKFTAYSDSGTNVLNTTIYYAEEDNPSVPATYAGFDVLYWTGVAWNGITAWLDGTQYESATIASLIQDIVNREGWVRGNAMLFLIEPSGATTAMRSISSYDFTSSEKAELHITYDIIEELEDEFNSEEAINATGIFDKDLEDSNNFEDLVSSTGTFNGSTLADSFNSTDLSTLGFLYEKSLSDNFNGEVLLNKILYISMFFVDAIDSIETITAYKPVYESILDSLFIWDNIKSQWQLNLSDGSALTDSSTIYLLMVLNDYLFTIDALSSQYNGKTILSDSLHSKDSISWLAVINRSLSDGLAATDSFTPILTLMVIEYLAAKDTVIASGNFNKSIIDTVKATDSMVSQWLLSLVDSFTSTDAISQLKFIVKSLADGITISDVFSSVGTFNISIEESARIVEMLQNGYGLSFSDSLAGTTTFSSLADLYNTLSESMTATDAITASLVAYLSISDNAVIVDSLSSNGVLYNTLTEAVKLNILIEIDADIYECWVLNTPQFYPSVYSGFNFNSYAVFNNRIFAANSTGVFELTGTTDNGTTIHSGVQFQETDFGTSAKKRIRKGFLGISGTTPVMSMEETNTDTKRTYTISEKGEVSSARDIVGKRWKMSVMDFDTLDSVQLVPIVLTPRR